MEKYLFAALCIAAVSHTIAFTSIFKGVRELVSRLHPKLEELIHCPWCLSHYVAAFVLFTSNDLPYVQFSDNVFINFMFTWFAFVAISGLCHYVLLRAYEPVAKAMMLREQQKRRTKKPAPKLVEEDDMLIDHLVN